jgi:CBS domain-containing protein
MANRQSQRTSIFSKLIGDFVGPLPLLVAPDTSLRETIGRMADGKASVAVITDIDNHPLGILTEQDVTRRITFRADAGQPVSDVMSSPVHTIAQDEYLYYAVARMRRRGTRHLTVVDVEGRVVGMLDIHRAMADASSHLMGEIDALTREDSVEGLTEIKAAQVDLAEHLLTEGLPVPEIQALLTHVNNDIYRRVVNLNLSAMADEGLGKPPVRFCVIVMGSGGRGENFIYPDQDNGFILDDYPDADHTRIDAWFIDLAERVTRDLDRVGLPLCKGYVMATNPLWRKTRSQWKQQVEIWNKRRNTTILRLCDIFFDFRSSWGDADMADELRLHITKVVGGNTSFLRDMYEDDSDHGTALGWFGRFITEKDDQEHLGEMNLKHTATLPLVEAMRLLALREGIEEISTLARMQALHEKGILENNEFDYLEGAFRTISQFLLRQQIKDFKAGKAVSNYVDPKSLTERERDILTDSLKAIHTLRERMRSEFTGEIF